MKTCKTGCGGKMKAGGSVKKVKKMATGGQALNKAKGFASAQKGGDNVSKQIYGVPNAGTTGPNRTAGYDYKKGGPIKKMKAGGSSNPCPKGYHWDGYLCRENVLHSLGSKLGVGTVVTGALGVAGKYIGDKIKEKKAAKKEAEEKKKKAAETPKAKFGASVGVKASCKNGMVRDENGRCVMVRKAQSGGSLKPVDKSKNPGLAKLPTPVRNKMGYAKRGGIKKR
jgi:hypothetical protein